MPKVSEMFPARYVTGAELKGKSYTVTIARVQREPVRSDAQGPAVDNWVLYTIEGKKGILLSKTLAYQLAQILGSEDTEAWAGQQIVIYPQAMPIPSEEHLVIGVRAVGAKESGAKESGG